MSTCSYGYTNYAKSELCTRVSREINRKILLLCGDVEQNPGPAKKGAKLAQRFKKTKIEIDIQITPGASNIEINNDENISKCNDQTAKRKSEPGPSGINKKSKKSYSDAVSNKDLKSKNDQLNVEPSIKFKKHAQASHHQGFDGYSPESRGNQCTCMAMVALALLPRNDKIFKADTLDLVLSQGDRVYQEVSRRIDVPIGRHLEFWQLNNSEFIIDDKMYHVKVTATPKHVHYKDPLGVNQSDVFVPLPRLIREFVKCPHNLVMIGQYAIAVWKYNNLFFVFDSHGRDQNGKPIPDGLASVWAFEDAPQLCDFLLEYMNNVCSDTYWNLEFQPVTITVKRNDSNTLKQCTSTQVTGLNDDSWLSRYITNQENVTQTRNNLRSQKLQEAANSMKSPRHVTKSAQKKREMRAKDPEKAKTSQNEYRNRKRKLNEEFVQSEREYNTDRMKKSRSKPVYRENENLNRAKSRSKLRSNPEYRENTNLYHANLLSELRSDPEYRENENVNRAKSRSKLRNDTEYRKKENLERAKARNEKRIQKEFDSTANERIQAFRESVEDGCAYVCVSCNRLLFKQSVTEYDDKTIELINQADKNLIENCIEICDDDEIDGKQWICTTCKSYMKRGKMAPQCVKNGLEIVDLVDDKGIKLVLSDLEYTLIARNILFIKVFQMPKSRWSAIKDRCINVPISEKSILKTMKQFPSIPSDAGIITVVPPPVPVNLKRKMELKNNHISQHVRVDVCYQALHALKKANNPYYQFDTSELRSKNEYLEACKTTDPSGFKLMNDSTEPDIVGSTSSDTEVNNDANSPGAMETDNESNAIIADDCTSNTSVGTEEIENFQSEIKNEEQSSDILGSQFSDDNDIDEETENEDIEHIEVKDMPNGVSIMTNQDDNGFQSDDDDISDACILRMADEIDNGLPIKGTVKFSTPEEDEHLEYIKNDPVRKFQWDKDDSTVLSHMCPEISVDINADNVISNDNSNSNQPESNDTNNSNDVANSDAHGNDHDASSTNERIQAFRKSVDAQGKSLDNALNEPINIAPGEGEIPVNRLTDKNWELKAFPNLFPDGNFGLYHDRPIHLSAQKFFEQRFLNKDPRFCIPGFYYSAATFLESSQLNNNISLSYCRGKSKTDEQGRKSFNLEDPLAVLDNISNTTKYWQKYKSEVIAKLKNLGPFQFFFTLSCAEKRWAENLVSIFRRKFGKQLENENGELNFGFIYPNEHVTGDDSTDPFSDEMEFNESNHAPNESNISNEPGLNVNSGESNDNQSNDADNQSDQTMNQSNIENEPEINAESRNESNGENTESNEETESQNDAKPKAILTINGVPWEDYLKERGMEINLNEEMRKNVLTLTRIFDRRLKMFTKHIIMGKNNPMHVNYFTYRIEFQSRGAGHAHGLLWLDLEAVKRDSKGKIIRDPDTNLPIPVFPGIKEAMRKIKNDVPLTEIDIKNLVEFVDSFVSVSLDDDDIKEIVKKVNTHHHTKTCRKYGVLCRFQFPKYPTLETIISVPFIYMTGLNKKGKPMNDKEKEAKFKHYQDVLKKVKENLEDDVLMADLELFTPEAQIEELCKLSKVSVEDYNMALKFTYNSYTVHHKRNIQERMVNNYNKEWLTAWNGNMDIQVCLDFYAVISYISDYVTKPESGLASTLLEAVKQTENLEHRERLHAIKDVFLTHRSMGESEVWYRMIPSLHLKDSNLKVEFVATGFPENRSHFLKKVNEDDLPFYDSATLCSVEGKQGKYCEKPAAVEKYVRRPKALEDMCLIQFVKMYDGISALPKSIMIKDGISHWSNADNVKLPTGARPGEIAVVEESEELELHHTRHRDFDKIIITPENFSGISVEKYRDLLLPKYIEIANPQPGEQKYMRLRSIPLAIRVYPFSKSKKRHEYLYSELLQYRAFRNENELHQNSEEECAALYKECVVDAIGNENDTEIIDSIVDFIDEDEDWQIYDKVPKVIKVKSIVMEHLEGVEEGKRKAEEILSDRIGALLDPELEQEQADGEDEGMQEHPEMPNLEPPVAISETRKCDKLYRLIELKKDEDLYKQTRMLDDEQMMVLEECVQYAKGLRKFIATCRNYPEVPRIMVQGGAGSGKSTVINTILQWMERILRMPGDNPEHPYILATAPTGAAAAVIDGQTLHNAFSFNFGNEYMPLNDKSRQVRRNVLQNLKFVIIDEISMVKGDMLYQLHLRLQEVKEKYNEKFGNVAILCFGDLLQLKPVQAGYVFQEPICTQYKPTHTIDPLWHSFKVINLVNNHRQGEDGPYADMLNRIRIGAATDEDIKLLSSRVRPENHPDIPKDAMYVTSTNAAVTSCNERVIESMNTEEFLNDSIHSCTMTKNYSPPISKNGFVHSTPFLDKLRLKVGARIMLTLNIDVNDSLTNSAMGEVLGYRRDGNGKVTDVIVHFFNPKAGANRRKKPENASLLNEYKDKRPTPIGRVEFEYKISKRAKISCKAKVIQYPIRLAFAATAHKFQGQTVHKPMKLVVDLRKVREPSQAYVMLSRVQALDQIFILETLPEHVLKPSEIALKEVERLNSKAMRWERSDNETLIVFQNTRSLRKHHVDIKKSKRHTLSDVLCISETWLSKDDNGSQFELEKLGKPIVVNAGDGKGLAIYSNTDVKDSTVKINHSNFQICKIHHNDINVITVYRSDSAKCSEVVKEIIQLCEPDKLTVIGGDLNFCALNEKDNKIMKELEKIGFKQLVSEPTHIQGRAIDHCYVREATDSQIHLNKNNLSIRSVYWSDHDALILSVPKEVEK